jgi:hypothetical protein
VCRGTGLARAFLTDQLDWVSTYRHPDMTCASDVGCYVEEAATLKESESTATEKESGGEGIKKKLKVNPWGVKDKIKTKKIQNFGVGDKMNAEFRAP